jgi:hypothetical protein
MQSWAYPADEESPFTLTTDGNPCHFPFTYKGDTYTECTPVDNGNQPWCSLTASYEYYNSRGNCSTDTWILTHTPPGLGAIVPLSSDLSAIIFAVFYIIYICECRGCHTKKYLTNIIKDPRVFAGSIHETCTSLPASVCIAVSCSHQETTHSTDSDGNRTSSTKTVVTYSASLPLAWTGLSDTSDFAGMSLAEVEAAVQDWGQTNRALLEVDQTWSLTDTDGSLKRACTQAHAENRHRDTSCSVCVQDAKPQSFRACRSLQVHDMIGAVSLEAFWISSVLLLTIPFRVYFETWTGKVKLAYVKSMSGATLAAPTQPGVAAAMVAAQTQPVVAAAGQQQQGALPAPTVVAAVAVVVAPAPAPAMATDDATATASVAAPAGHHFCTSCGAKLETAAKFCSGCGTHM